VCVLHWTCDHCALKLRKSREVTRVSEGVFLGGLQGKQVRLGLVTPDGSGGVVHVIGTLLDFDMQALYIEPEGKPTTMVYRHATAYIELDQPEPGVGAYHAR
jgi:hypothetical protein